MDSPELANAEQILQLLGVHDQKLTAAQREKIEHFAEHGEWAGGPSL